MVFDEQRDLDDIFDPAAGRLDSRDEVVEGTIHLGFEVIGAVLRDSDLTGDVDDLRLGRDD